MRLFLDYIRSKRKILILLLVWTILFFVFFALYHLPLMAVLYPAVLGLLCAVAFFLADFFRLKKVHDTLSLLRIRAAERIDALPRPEDPIARDYQALLRALQEETVGLQAANEAKYDEMVNYYTVWAHQIKTPISSMKLSLQNEDSPLCRRLLSEIFRIEQYVEMVLTFLRLNSETSDYVFAPCRLDDMIRPAVRKFSSEFIGRKLKLEYEPILDTVVTDEKWFSFVVEQVISNALKYTKEGKIRIDLCRPNVLRISDTGIGIAPEDLPRIFDRGYTGYNGRTDKSASGIGLYLCQRICRNLGVRMTAESKIGCGTAILIDFSQYQLKTE